MIRNIFCDHFFLHFTLFVLQDIKCSANWMWAAKLPGEGWALYEACEAMCEVMKAVGVGVDGGKDSLSMAARVGGQRVVKAPGDLVVSAYAPCTDVTKVGRVRVPNLFHCLNEIIHDSCTRD